MRGGDPCEARPIAYVMGKAMGASQAREVAALRSHVAYVGGARTFEDSVDAKIGQRFVQVLKETAARTEEDGRQGDFKVVDDA